VEPNFEEFDPDSLDEIDQMIEHVNFVAKIQDSIKEGFSDVWVTDKATGRSKLIFILSLPH
jgi:hypothetical protein